MFEVHATAPGFFYFCLLAKSIEGRWSHIFHELLQTILSLSFCPAVKVFPFWMLVAPGFHVLYGTWSSVLRTGSDLLLTYKLGA